MSLKLKHALIIALASTTSLTAYASTNPYSVPKTHSNVNNRMNVHKGHKSVKPSHPKAYQAPKTKQASALPMEMNFIPFKAKEVFITFDNELDILKNICKEYESQTITFEKMIEINDKIVDIFIADNYLLPQVNLDKLAMLSGVLKFDVKAGHINEVVVIGNGENNKLIQQYANNILKSNPTKKSEVQRYLSLMNKVPGMEVTYQLVPNIEASNDNNVAVDLVIYTSQKKASAFIGADNFGSNDLGNYQFTAMAEVYNPFSSRDSLLFNATTSNHPDRLSDFGIGYSYILNSYGTSAHLFVAHSEDNPTKGDEFSANDGTGTSYRGALTHHLFLRAHHDLEVELGTQYRDSTSYQVVNNVSTKYKVSKFTTGDVGLRYLFKDKLEGRNLAHTKYTYGLSGTYDNYIDSDIADKNFKKFNFDFFREQSLPNNFSAFFHYAVSYSQDNLPDAERSVVGGRDFGRAYDFGTLDGNKMTGISLEMRYNKLMESKYAIEYIQPYLYIDSGHSNRQDESTTVSTLSSAGGGLRINFLNNLDFGIEVAQPFKKNFTVDEEEINASTRVNFFINKTFKF